MVDILTPDQRTYNMRNVKSRDTTPELLIRKSLHAKGLRYKLHAKNLPGTPDLVFTKYKTVVFVHGCFWHRHNCHKTSVPASRIEFWEKKFNDNTTRDKMNIKYLSDLGWRVLIIWECALKGQTKLPLVFLIEAAVNFIKNDSGQLLELSGTN